MHLPIKKKIIWLILISFIIVSSLIAVAIKCLSDRKNKNANDPNIVTDKIVIDHRYNFKLVHAKEPEKGLLIYISDANSPAVTANYTQKFAELSYYVANIDSQTLLNSLKNTDNQCVHLAEALKSISKQLQDSYKIDSDELPILVGNNEGAALVYAALVQTDKHYFHAGVSINFAPHLDSKVPLCSLNNIDNPQTAINTMSPAKNLSTNWYVFQSA